MHWGNILVSYNSPDFLESGLEELSLSETVKTSHGSSVKVTLIDYTLSRATMADGTVFYNRFEDSALFEGKGKVHCFPV